jgi:hypothetical protein
MLGQLGPRGYLLLGAAETTFTISDDYDRHLVGRTAWYRPQRNDPNGGADR